jgi:hypothetical protein
LELITNSGAKIIIIIPLCLPALNRDFLIFASVNPLMENNKKVNKVVVNENKFENHE